jgi:hypothetical protein
LQNRELTEEAKEMFQQQIDELNNHHSAKHLNGLFDHNFLAGLDKDIALPDYWRIKVQDLKEIIRKQEDILASNFKVFWYTSEEIAELKTEIEERKKQLETAEENLKQREERVNLVSKVADMIDNPLESLMKPMVGECIEFMDDFSNEMKELAPAFFKLIGKRVR